MKDLSLAIKSNQANLRWYRAERNTAELIQEVVRSRGATTLSGDDIWNLIRLTWITAAKSEATDRHWKRLKIPALMALFNTHVEIKDDLLLTLNSSAGIPQKVAEVARERSGFVNFRNVWRESSRSWCNQNSASLRRIVSAAATLTWRDDCKRIELARRLRDLPLIPSPGDKASCHPDRLLTPFVACLDPEARFPVINGRKEVADMLAAMRLASGDLEHQVKHLLRLIGRFGIADAFMIDVLAGSKALADLSSKLDSLKNQKTRAHVGTALRYYDDAEREASRKAGTFPYRQLHNRMTKALGMAFNHLKIEQGDQQNCRFDALIRNYDGAGRDLLIEAKPDPDRGSMRIAIGQLLDYRRFLPNQAGTDLAVLTISCPAQEYLELLEELQVTSIWFTSESCTKLNGKGSAWDAIS